MIQDTVTTVKPVCSRVMSIGVIIGPHTTPPHVVQGKLTLFPHPCQIRIILCTRQPRPPPDFRGRYMCWKCDYLAPICPSCDPNQFEDICYYPPKRYEYQEVTFPPFLDQDAATCARPAEWERPAGEGRQAVPRRAPALRETISIGTTTPPLLARAQILIWADLIMN